MHIYCENFNKIISLVCIGIQYKIYFETRHWRISKIFLKESLYEKYSMNPKYKDEDTYKCLNINMETIM